MTNLTIYKFDACHTLTKTRRPAGLQRCNKGPDVAGALGPEGAEGPQRGPQGLDGAHRAPKEPVGTDGPKGFKFHPCNQNSTGRDMGHVTSSSEGPKGARRDPMRPRGSQRSPEGPKGARRN